MLSPNPTAFNFTQFLENTACNADAVIIGEVRTASPQLTEDESFIFTNYDITVEEVVKDNAFSPIQTGSNITVARVGGDLRLGRRNIQARVHGFLPLETGKRYLLFLQFVPEKGAYIAHESRGSFLISDEKIVKLTEDQLPPELENGNDARSFVNAIRIAITGSCERTARQ